MKKVRKPIFVSILLLAFTILFSFPVVQAIEYEGLGILPNESEVDEKNPLSKAWFIYNLEPGEVKRGKVDIANLSDTSLKAKVYPVDAVTTKDGAFAPEPEDREKVGVGTWIILAESEVSLKPKETKTIDFTLKVPQNAEVGDHMGAIIVQSKEPPKAAEGTGLRIATRVGARLYITVPGDIVKKLEFEKFTREVKDGKTTFSLTFVNKGNVRIGPKGEIKITDIFGKETDSIKITEREVFPEKTITIPIEWDKNLFWGKFTVRAKAVYNEDQTLTKELTFWILPSQKTLLALGAGIIIIILLTPVIIRKIRAKRDVKSRNKR